MKNKKILLTGGNGFLGKHIRKLLENDNILICPSRKEYNLILEKDVIRLFEKYNNIDYIIHAAADVGGIGYSSSNSSKQFYNNILMNTYILHYSWKYKVSKFVGIGSVCEYPAKTTVPFKESTLWDGYPAVTNDAYGFSKRMLFAQSIMYKRDYDYNCIHLLPVNLYGPGDDFSLENSHVIPALIRKIHIAKTEKLPYVDVWGTGNESREFLYVKDAAKGIISATKKYNKIDAVNLGSGQEITISSLCDIISKKMGYTGTFKYLDNGLGGQNRRMLDVSLAKAEFDFIASTPFEEGIDETIRYFYRNLDRIMRT